MRMQRWKIAAIVVAMVAGGVSSALADVGASEDPDYPGFSAVISAIYPYTTETDNQSIGWRFYVDKPIIITHVGLFDFGDNGLSCAHQMGIWGVGNTVDLLRGPIDIGPGGTPEGHYVYASVGEPLIVGPGTTLPYARLLIGVWTGSGNTERLVLFPVGAVTYDAQAAGVLRHQSYTVVQSDVFTKPWGFTEEHGHHFGVNFKYTVVGSNQPPVAYAGENVTIQSADQAVTILQGSASDADGDALQYRWLEGGTVLLNDWTAVEGGAAPLDLGALGTLPLGPHTLTLEVKDDACTSSATMLLTLLNTPPSVVVTPSLQTVEIGVDPIDITGTVADFDADALSYRWLKNGVELASGTVTPPTDGGPWEGLDLTFDASDPRFPLGTHQVTLEVTDGKGAPVTKTAEVIVADSQVPTLAPASNVSMLWPPDHTLRPVTILANAWDGSGEPVTLAATVQCNEDDGGSAPDWTAPVITGGEISLSLCAERSGKGSGRVYTIRITATDTSGNQSSAEVEVCVPHDRRKN